MNINELVFQVNSMDITSHVTHQCLLYSNFTPAPHTLETDLYAYPTARTNELSVFFF